MNEINQMNSEINNLNGFIEYLNLTSIDDFNKLKKDHDLICKVGQYLLNSKQKITFGKVSEILGINRASIYNTYLKATIYIKALIVQQKAEKKLKPSFQKKSGFPERVNKSQNISQIDKDKITKFMTIIMSLEQQTDEKNRKIHELQAKVASLQSTIQESRLQK